MGLEGAFARLEGWCCTYHGWMHGDIWMGVVCTVVTFLVCGMPSQNVEMCDAATLL